MKSLFGRTKKKGELPSWEEFDRQMPDKAVTSKASYADAEMKSASASSAAKKGAILSAADSEYADARMNAIKGGGNSLSDRASSADGAVRSGPLSERGKVAVGRGY